MYWPSKSSLTTSSLWKKLPKHMKWVFMGTWTVEDSILHAENPDFKMQQNMAYLNKRKQKVTMPLVREEDSED